jgi:hypothetical protein
MFFDRRAFRSGESGRWALAFVMARAAAGLLVLHKCGVPMRLYTEVVLWASEWESRRRTHREKKHAAAPTRRGNCKDRKIRPRRSPLSSLQRHTCRVSRFESIAGLHSQRTRHSRIAPRPLPLICTKSGHTQLPELEYCAANRSRREFNNPPCDQACPRRTSPSIRIYSMVL